MIKIVHSKCYLLIFKIGSIVFQIEKKIIASDVTKSGLLEGILQSDILAQKSKLLQCVYTLLFFLFKIHVLLIFSYIKSDITWFYMISKKKKAFSLCDVLILQNRNTIDQIDNVKISDGTKPGLLDGILKNGLLAPKSKNVFFEVFKFYALRIFEKPI